MSVLQSLLQQMLFGAREKILLDVNWILIVSFNRKLLKK